MKFTSNEHQKDKNMKKIQILIASLLIFVVSISFAEKENKPTAKIRFSKVPKKIKPNSDVKVSVKYKSNFAKTSHRGRVYLEIIDAKTNKVLSTTYKDAEGKGLSKSKDKIDFNIKTPEDADQIYFRTYISPVEMNDLVIKEYMSYPQDGSFPYMWEGNGVTHDIIYKDEVILKDTAPDDSCYCCGITYEVFMDMYNDYNKKYGFDSIGKISVDDMKEFRKIWYVSVGGAGAPGCATAITDYNIGYTVTDLEKAMNGDFIQFWRYQKEGRSGHSVIFKEWVRDKKGEITGLHYWSTQGATNGISFRTEMFGKEGDKEGLNKNKVYIGRPVKPADKDDWQNRYADADTSKKPTRVIK